MRSAHACDPRTHASEIPRAARSPWCGRHAGGERHVQRLVSASFIDDLFPGNLFFNATVAYADDKMDLGIRSIAKNMYTVIVGVLVSHELKRCAE